MFVPATPESELADRVKSVVDEECKRLGFKVKVVERGGVTMKQHLVKTDMGRSVPCPMEDCLLCLTNPGEGGGARHQRAGPYIVFARKSTEKNLRLCTLVRVETVDM